MGAKTWMLVYADSDARGALMAHPRMDRAATRALAARLFPGEKLEPIEDGNLCFTSPPDDELVIGCFDGVSVVAAKEFALDRPSALPERFIEAGGGGSIALHAMHSVVDWFAYAQWTNGTLIRSFSVAPDSGILEDLGARQPFEAPYWSGEHPAGDPGESDAFSLPFHPLELGEAALDELFGFQIEGVGGPVDPESITLMRFKRSASRPRWKFWA